jgi:UDP-glucuronate 4-epimerase
VLRAAAAAGGRFRVVEADIRDRHAVRVALAHPRVDRVVHLAAWAGVRPSVERPGVYYANNVDGTEALLRTLVEAGIRKVVFASSSSVYGNEPRRPFSEDSPADRPLSPYAATKRSGELICHVYHHLHGLETTCLRFFTAVGPRQRPDLALHKFALLLDRGEPVTLYGDGSSTRDYTDVGDIVDGVVRALDRVSGYRILNLGAGRPIRLSEVVDTLARALGVAPRIRHAPPQPGDVDATLADIARARAELGYAPRTSFAESAGRFVRWFREEADAGPSG